MFNHKVSIIVPVYNVENYLKDALESIFNQTYNFIQLIIVNDGSTDNSQKIINEMIDTSKIERFQIKLIKQENKGLSCARNKGLDVASGKYIYFMDSDDILERTLIEKAVKTMETNSSDIVFFDGKSFTDEEDLSLLTHRFSYHNLNPSEIFTKEKFYRLEKPFSPVYLYLIKKSVLYDLRFEENVIHEDEIFTPYLLHNVNKISYINECLYFRRYRSGSIMTGENSSKKKKSSEGYRVAVSRLYDLSKEEKTGFFEKRFLKKKINYIRSTILFNKSEEKSVEKSIYVTSGSPFKAKLIPIIYLMKVLKIKVKLLIKWDNNFF